MSVYKNYKKAANWVIVEVTAALNRQKYQAVDNPCIQASCGYVNMVDAGEISQRAKIVFETSCDGIRRRSWKKGHMKQMSDSELLPWSACSGQPCPLNFKH